MKLIRAINEDDVKAALDEVAQKCSAETTNLLRAVYESFFQCVEQPEPVAQPAPVGGWYAPR